MMAMLHLQQYNFGRESLKLSRNRLFMPSSTRTTAASKTNAFFLALMLVFTTLTLATPTASAIGPNQNDFATGFDLPDNMSGISSTFVANLSVFDPVYFSHFGVFDVNDDEAWVAVNLSANEVMALELSFNSTYTSSNGSTYCFTRCFHK